jgi:hypothetical protein
MSEMLSMADINSGDFYEIMGQRVFPVYGAKGGLPRGAVVYKPKDGKLIQLFIVREKWARMLKSSDRIKFKFEYEAQ